MRLCWRPVCIFLFAPLVGLAQHIENVKATVVGDHVIVNYDIAGAAQGSKFTAQLYSSHNNFSAPLTRVTGDVGEVTGGPGKRIDWDARGELQTFSGEVSFEVRAAPVFVPWQFRSPTAGSSIKMGKVADLGWSGGSSSATVRIELLRNGNVVRQVGQSSNSGTYAWKVPKDLEKGGGYQFRVTSGSEGATSQSFLVKKKTSPILFIAPLAVAGGVAALLGGGGGGNNKGGGLTDLPVAPSVPSQ